MRTCMRVRLVSTVTYLADTATRPQDGSALRPRRRCPRLVANYADRPQSATTSSRTVPAPSRGT